MFAKGWSVYPAAVVFVVAHHIRCPNAIAKMVRDAPAKVQYRELLKLFIYVYLYDNRTATVTSHVAHKVRGGLDEWFLESSQ